MSAPKTKRPAWAEPYLLLEAWTQEELRNLLCGLPPTQPLDEPPRTREEATAYFIAAELKRVEADRHIRDAVLAGKLTVANPVSDDLLAKVQAVLLPGEFETVSRALVHERVCKKAYYVTRTDAIRWASRRPDFFPDFPFDDSDLPGGGVALDGPASALLKEHRRNLLARKLDELGIMTQGAFCKSIRISPDALRGIVNGDRSRYSEETERKVIAALKVTLAEWNEVR